MSSTGAFFIALMLATNHQHSLQEEQCEAFVVMREAGGESKRARRAVLDVLQHRMRKMHKSCRATVAQAHQWSWYKKGMKLKVDRKSLQAYRDVATLRPVLKSCAAFFHSGSKPNWAKKMKMVHKEEKLKFYC